MLRLSKIEHSFTYSTDMQNLHTLYWEKGIFLILLYVRIFSIIIVLETWIEKMSKMNYLFCIQNAPKIHKIEIVSKSY